MPKIRAETIAEHKEQTRRELLDAAEQIFAAQGYNNTPLSQIADLAGVARTTLYDYFPNKNSLVLGLVASRAETATAEIIGDADADAPPIDQLEALLRRALAFAAGSPHLARLVTRVGRKLPDDEQEAIWATLDPVVQEIGRILVAGIESGSFPSMNVDLGARMAADHIMCAVDELLRVSDPEAHLPEVEAEWLRWLRRALRSD